VILSKKVHGYDFEWLRSYGHFLIPIHALNGTALTEPAGGRCFTVCIASITFASCLAHPKNLQGDSLDVPHQDHCNSHSIVLGSFA